MTGRLNCSEVGGTTGLDGLFAVSSRTGDLNCLEVDGTTGMDGISAVSSSTGDIDGWADFAGLLNIDDVDGLLECSS